MSRTEVFGVSKSNPVVVGTGLVALDVVFSKHQPEPIGRWAGGTCGNVLAILSWLGWGAWPIARFKSGEEATAIRRDLKRWGVQLQFIEDEAAGKTPVIIQYIGRNVSGEVTHRFSTRCPVCGSRLPAFRPMTGSAVGEILPHLPDADVFYFDRTSRGILDLAADYHESGAVIVFEPSAVGVPRYFEEALELAHVVKFADDRLSSCELDLPDNYPSLYIETSGRTGLRYSCRLERYRTRGWQEVCAYEVPMVCDAAGAGDWCTAGLLHQICSGGIDELKKQHKSGLIDAFRIGQAMASWNCRFMGARGGMYRTSVAKFQQAITEIYRGECQSIMKGKERVRSVEEYACAACQGGI